MSSGLSKSGKRLVRELQELRGCVYTAALAELREVDGTVSWRAYIDRVKANMATDTGDLTDLERGLVRVRR